MKVTDAQRENDPFFADLNIGDIFILNKETYIKINNCKLGYNAFCFTTNTEKKLRYENRITRRDAELVLL